MEHQVPFRTKKYPQVRKIEKSLDIFDVPMKFGLLIMVLGELQWNREENLPFPIKKEED